MIIGLTGGICTGKSTVGRIFEEFGAHVIDADELAHGVIVKGSRVHDEIARIFGPSVVLTDGEIDRNKLGAIVFSNSGLRKRLEALVHP